eukprot:9280829-Alexandrium_andersonii.AAC.1
MAIDVHNRARQFETALSCFMSSSAVVGSGGVSRFFLLFVRTAPTGQQQIDNCALRAVSSG